MRVPVFRMSFVLSLNFPVSSFSPAASKAPLRFVFPFVFTVTFFPVILVSTVCLFLLLPAAVLAPPLAPVTVLLCVSPLIPTLAPIE